MTPAQRAEALRLAEALSARRVVTKWRRGADIDYPVLSEQDSDCVAAATLLRALVAQADAQAEPAGWIESPHGQFRANPSVRFSGPQSVAWSIPLYAHPPAKQAEPVAWLWPGADDGLCLVPKGAAMGLFGAFPVYASPQAPDAADARRYRWLREQHWSKGTLAVVHDPKNSVELGSYLPSHELLDAAIDAAIAKEKP